MSSRKTENELLDQLQKGGAHSFVVLVKTYERPLLNFFYRLTWDRFLAEDFTQEVFFRLYRSLDKISFCSSLSTYVFKTAKNIWIDAYRAKKRRITEIHPSQIGQTEGEEPSDLLSQTAGPSAAPPDILIGQETVEKVQKALNQLSFEKRMVFIMGEHLGMKYERIAEILEIPIGTVKSRMHSAVKELKEYLEVD